MDLRAIRNRIDHLLGTHPAITGDASEDATTRNAKRLAGIAAEPLGPRRNFAIVFHVRTAALKEEPEAFRALNEAIVAEAIARAFPNGLPAQPSADSRARLRAWKAPPRMADSLGETLRARIAERARVAEVQS